MFSIKKYLKSYLSTIFIPLMLCFLKRCNFLKMNRVWLFCFQYFVIQNLYKSLLSFADLLNLITMLCI
jgi:hypothetical protein